MSLSAALQSPGYDLGSRISDGDPAGSLTAGPSFSRMHSSHIYTHEEDSFDEILEETVPPLTTDNDAELRAGGGEGFLVTETP